VSNGSSSAVLRVGVAQVLQANPLFGIRQLSQNLAFESIARIGEDARMQPALAESWTISSDGRTLSVKFRSRIKFHDGSPLDIASLARTLPDALRSLMGVLYSDIESVSDSSPGSIEVHFRRASPFL